MKHELIYILDEKKINEIEPDKRYLFEHKAGGCGIEIVRLDEETFSGRKVTPHKKYAWMIAVGIKDVKRIFVQAVLESVIKDHDVEVGYWEVPGIVNFNNE